MSMIRLPQGSPMSGRLWVALVALGHILAVYPNPLEAQELLGAFPAGTIAIDEQLQHIAVAHRTVRVYRLGSGERIHEFEVHDNWREPAVFTSLRLHEDRLLGSNSLGNVRTWSLPAGTASEWRNAWFYRQGPSDATLAPVPVAAMDFSRSGRLLATAMMGTALVWEIDSGRLLASFRGHPPNPGSLNASCLGTVFGLAPDSQRLPELLAVLGRTKDSDLRDWQEAKPYQVSSVAFGRADRLLVTSGYQGTDVWDVRSGDALLHVPNQGLSALLADGDTLVVASRFGPMEIWSVGRRRRLRTIEHRAVALAASKWQMACYTSSEFKVVCWDARNWTERFRVPKGAWEGGEPQELVVGGRDRDVVVSAWSGLTRDQVQAWSIPALE